MLDPRDSLIERALELPGVEERPSQWNRGTALWVDGREILHCEGDQTVDVRFTHAVLAGLAPHPLVEATGRRDWAEVRVAAPGDVDAALELVAQAVAANRR